MTTNGEITERFFEVAPNHSRMLGRGYSSTVKPSADGRELYPYGSHFPMVRAMLGRDGTPDWWLLNGDRFSNTTNRHQSDVRGCAERTGLPTLIVPFSALDAAGIIKDSIQIIEVTPDTWLEHERSSADLSAVPKRFRERWDPNAVSGRRGAWETVDGRNVWNPERVLNGGMVPVRPDADGLYRWTVNEHRLGSAVFRARYAFDRLARRLCRGPFVDQERERWTAYRDTVPDAERFYTVAVCSHDRTEPHRTFVREQGTADFLSAFDMQESPPLYFLAQLPKDQATDVA